MIFLSLLITAAHAAGPTCADVFTKVRESQRLAWLETESPETIARIREENSRVNKLVDRSPNTPVLETLIKDVLVKERTSASAALRDGTIVKVVNLGIGRGEIIKIGDEVVLNNRQFKKSGGAHIDSIRLSPREDHILVNLVTEGSTDDYQTVIFDMATRGISNPVVRTAEAEPVWHTNDTYFATTYSKETNAKTLNEFSIAGTSIDLGKGFISGRTKEGATMWTKENGKELILNDGSHFPALEAEKVLGRVGNTVVYVVKLKEGRAIRTGEIIDGKLQEIKTVATEETWATGDEKLVGSYITYRRSRGDERIVVIRDLAGAVVKEIRMPNGVQGFASSWAVEGKVIKLGLTSAVIDTQYVKYDLEKGFDQDIDALMFTKNGVEYKSEVVEVTSADGTKIPVRLTSRKDIVTRAAPAVMEVYGGFERPGYFDPKHNVMDSFFLENGGVLVHPAVRGGNEFGKAWAEAARKANKEKTLEDVIAAADQLGAQGRFNQKKLVLTGASNGGMVTAAAALKSPSSFALVIPINGVQDSYGKEVLDARHGTGWVSEYGDSRSDAAAILESYGPVENAAKPGPVPKFLIIGGRNDSRVHPAHSRKLLEALRSQPGRDVYLYSLKNGGHWMNSLPYQDWIAWRTQVVIWSQIYDLAGIKLNAPPANP